MLPLLFYYTAQGSKCDLVIVSKKHYVDRGNEFA